MSFRHIQQPATSESPLAVCYLLGSDDDAFLRDTLPGCEIWTSAEAPLQPGPLPSGRPLILIGFSAGCQPVRAHIVAGLHPIAVVTADGTHASIPPAPWQIACWQQLALEARRGERVWVASCTSMGYTEQIKPGQPGRATSTWHVLEAAIGQKLELGEGVHEGGLHVIRYPSADTDKAAHIRQQNEVLPDLLRRYVTPLLAGRPAIPPPAEDDADTDPAPPWRMSMGERLVAWYHAEKAAGVREVPPGSNTGPRVAQYLAVCRRRGTEKPLGLTAGAWCAAMASFGLQQVALPGEPYPAPRAAGIELQQDAEDAGDWYPIEMVLSGAWHPAPGDLVVCARDTGWTRHMCVYLGREGELAIRTIGGNEGNEIRETVRQLRGGSEPILGFIRLLRQAVPLDAA